MTQTGPGTPPPAQPGQPYQAWGAGQQPPPPFGQPPVAPPAKSNAKKWASLAGSVVVAGGVAAFSLTGGFGLGDPEVGDCIEPGGNSFNLVDCGAEEAQYRIVGVEEKQQNYADFQADPDVCLTFPTAVYAAWYGGELTDAGSVFCAEEI